MSFSSDQPLFANQLPISIEFPEIEKDFDQILSLTYKQIADVVNTKEGALYQPQELATFKQYFTPGDPLTNRNVYRKTIDFGVLPNTGTKSVPHGIAFNSKSSLTMLYGAATDPIALSYIPLPYSSPTLADNIELFADGTNISVRTGANWNTYTICTVVIEYLKN